MRHHRLGSLFVLLLAVLCASPCGSEEPVHRPVDRVVAMVDRDPIFWSDLNRVIGLSLASPRPEESRSELERRVLDALIEQKLRLHEIERLEFRPLSSTELERQLEAVRGSFEGPGAYEQELLRLGLSEEGLRRLLTRQLRVLLYIEERLAPRIFIDQEEVRAYYEETLGPTLLERGEPVPELARVQGAIEDLLREIRLNEEIERWTEELRLEAEIIDFFERSTGELPPVRRRYGPEDF